MPEPLSQTTIGCDRSGSPIELRDCQKAIAPKTFRFAVNSHGKNKDWDFRLLAGKFEDKQGSIQDVIQHVSNGHALCAGLLSGQWRSKRNVIGSEWILLDIDNSGIDEQGNKVYQQQLTLDQALEHPFIKQHCALIYTTASHRPDWHKFRLIFRLPEFVADVDAYEAMVRLLMEQLPHDPACKDASRVFYGSTDASFPLVNPDAALPADWLTQAIAQAEQAKQEQAERLRQLTEKRRQFRELAAEEGWDTDELIQQALAFIPPRQPGTGNYDECRQVLMALVDHFGESEAEQIAEAWSPSIKGTTWNIPQKIRSFRGSGITIGTLFHIAGQYGFRFPTKREWKDPTEPDIKLYQQHIEREREQEQIEQLQHKQAQQQWLGQYQQQARSAWLRSKSFTPNQVVEQQYVSVEEDLVKSPQKTLHALRSDMGTGKTEALTHLLSKADAGVIAIGSRNGLLLQSCERWGRFYHLHQDNAFALISDRYSRIACCIDSLVHFKPSDFDGRIIVLDEVVSIIKHGLFSTTLKGKRNKVLTLLEEAIKRASLIIAWDGNCCDIAVNYLANLAGGDCKIIKQLNTFRGDRLNVEFVRSLSPVTGNPKLRDYSALIAKIKQAVAECRLLDGDEPRALAIVTDSQVLAESLDNLLTGDKNPDGSSRVRVLRCDSKTVREEEGKAFLKTPNEVIKELRPDVVILSPSAESGLDISLKNYFRRGFAFFFGVVDADTQKQMLRRFRDCWGWSVWCVEYSAQEEWEGTNSPFARRLQAQLMDYLQADLKAALEGTDREQLAEAWTQSLRHQVEDPHNQTALQLMAARNFERSHTRECLQTLLEGDGHQCTLIDLDSNHAARDAYKAAKDEVLDEYAQNVFQADIVGLSLSWAITQRSQFGASLEDEYKAEKLMLLHRLPGIEDTEIWSVDLVRRLLFTERGLISKLERYCLLKYQDAAKNRAIDQWQQAIENGAFLGDIKSDYRYLQALTKLDILSLVERDELLDKTNPDVLRICQRVKRSKPLQIALKRQPGKEPMAFVGRLLSSIGIEREAKLTRGKGATRGYHYPAPESHPLNQVLLNCVAKRLEKYSHAETLETGSASAPKADHLPPKEEYLLEPGDPAEYNAQSAVECDRRNSNKMPLEIVPPSQDFPRSSLLLIEPRWVVRWSRTPACSLWVVSAYLGGGRVRIADQLTGLVTHEVDLIEVNVAPGAI